jgi:hypothetical protein
MKTQVSLQVCHRTRRFFLRRFPNGEDLDLSFDGDCRRLALALGWQAPDGVSPHSKRHWSSLVDFLLSRVSLIFEDPGFFRD